MRTWTFLGLGLLTAAWLPSAALAIDNAECFACHGDKELTKKGPNGNPISLFVDEGKYAKSIHAKNLCTSCHADIKEVPHDAKLKPVGCGQCHRIETDIYLKSDHGIALSKGVTEAATCQACHGEPHQLLNYRNPDSPVHRLNIHDTCAKCHAKTQEMEKFGLSQRGPIISYDKSVHGIALMEKSVSASAVCTDCHGSHDLHKSTNPASKLYWQTIPVTCGKCHENVERTFLRSVHGKAVMAGERDAPVCTDCHGEHTISSVKSETSKVAPNHIPETCAQCHNAERIVTRYRLPPKVVDTYMRSFHGLGWQFGSPTDANCASCHGAHDILPSSDPLSSVNQANLPQTCGKCHPGIGTRLAKTEMRIHALPGAAEGKPWIVNFITRLYIVLIVLTIGGMAFHNGADFIAKAREHVRKVKTMTNAEVRFTPFLRWQHLVLVTLFILLAYTGFVHKYPEAWWGWPFRAIEEGSWWRGIVHRVSGWLFAGFFVIHGIMLLATTRGRGYFRDLWPRKHDATDAMNLMQNRLCLKTDPLPHRRFNYIEKSEYWALVWGSFVMIITGAMLIFTDTVLRMLPKVWHDVAQVIHFYEAVLATLAIIVWHFYWVIFDPSEYPMNPAWLIGKKAPHGEGHSSPSPSHSEDAAEKPQSTNNTGSPGKEAPPHDGS
jgi:cytochrome b subunit of formate dehydrogenase